MVDENTVRGLLAEFAGVEIKAMIASQVQEARTKASAIETQLGEVVAELAEDLKAADARPHPRYRRGIGDDRREHADDLKRRMRNYRRVASRLEVFGEHVDASKIYLLTEREVGDIQELDDEAY